MENPVMTDVAENAVEKPLSEALVLQADSEDLFARLSALRNGFESVAHQRAKQVLEGLLAKVSKGYKTLDAIGYLMEHDPEQAAMLAQDFTDLTPEGLSAQRERLQQLELNAQAQLTRLASSALDAE
jgi:hypothetical protein